MPNKKNASDTQAKKNEANEIFKMYTRNLDQKKDINGKSITTEKKNDSNDKDFDRLESLIH